MWRNLRDVGSAMSAIENIVAPVDGEEDDSEEEYEDEEYSEEEDPDDETEADNGPPLHQRFAAKAKSAVQSSRFTSLVSNVIQAATAGSDSEDDDDEEEEEEEEDFTEEEGTDQRMAEQQRTTSTDSQPTPAPSNAKATESTFTNTRTHHNGVAASDDWEEETWNHSHRSQEDPAKPNETIVSPTTPNRGLLKRESGSITPLQSAIKSSQEEKGSRKPSAAIMPPPLTETDDTPKPKPHATSAPRSQSEPTDTSQTTSDVAQASSSLSGSNHRHPRPPGTTKASPVVSKRVSASPKISTAVRSKDAAVSSGVPPPPLPSTRSPTPPNTSISPVKTTNKPTNNRPKPSPPVVNNGQSEVPSKSTPNTEKVSNGSASGNRQQNHYQDECSKLKVQLQQAERHILELQKAQRMSLEKEEAAQALFAQKEARLLAAAAEEHAQEMQKMQEQYESRLAAARQETENEHQHDEQLSLLLEQAERNLQTMENAHKKEMARLEKEYMQNIQRHERSTRLAQDQLATAQAKLDQATEQTSLLQEQVSELKSHVQDHARDSQEAEEEVEELHTENEQLESALAKQEQETSKWKAKAQDLRAEVDSLRGLKMELQMLKEEQERHLVQSASAAQSAESNTAQLIAARDGALAQVDDLQRQLSALTADLDLARADRDRAIMASENLQLALEAIQGERETELQLWQEQKQQQEEATAVAHAAALEATHEANEAHIRDIQAAARVKLEQAQQETKDLEHKFELLRQENVQTRRSLDEAIRRLQTTQEDVVDRSMMKNILLDWLTSKEKEKRKNVLQVMASLLHFTEAEKSSVNLDDIEGVSLSKLVQKAAALPPSKTDVEHLEGDNVREKWVNFLLAETE